MKKYGRLAVFGGTFSPIHNGHVAVISAYANLVSPDALYIVPTGVPPHKIREDSTSDADRLAMIKLAISDLDVCCDVVVSDVEIERGGKSYTVDTVDSLRDIADEIVIYCGTDMILSLDKWYDFERLLKNVSVAYMQRENDLRYTTEVACKVKELSETYGTKFIALPPVSDEISSSAIRKMIQKGEDISSFVPKKVMQYICKHNLYK